MPDGAPRELTKEEQHAHHDERDPHVRSRWLSDVVLGAQDGLVNTLGVVLGVAAASGDARVVFASGISAGLAESVATTPAIEREEVRVIYIRKGFDGELLERVVETICANKDVWVAVMMAEEHELVPIDRATSVRSAGVVGVAALAGSVVPVVPFALLALRAGVIVALVLGAVLLFALGAYKAKVTTGRRVRSGTELAVIGMTSAVVGYAIGAALGPSR